jgi:hypothetical protein
VAIDGTTGYPTLPFKSRWRKPGAIVKFGRPFRLNSQGKRADKEMLRQMTDEAMYILSAMLPEYRRGFYADLSRATHEFIEWV